MMRSTIESVLRGRTVVASISGGKDSAALSLWLREHDITHERVFLDTGWEHPATYEYIRGELSRVIGPILEIRGPRSMQELVRHKRFFPARRLRFCTQDLKVKPMQSFLAGLMATGVEVVNAVGIRAEESAARAVLGEWEWSDSFDCDVWRPLINWTTEDVIAIHKRHGLAPNPLYLAGAERVGCWPCIHARKSEIRMVADTDPGRIELVRDLEQEISDGAGTDRTWFQASGGRPMGIDDAVAWSRTSRGGKQFEIFADSAGGCMRWGLCDTGTKKPDDGDE